MTTLPLFPALVPAIEDLGPGAVLIRGAVADQDLALRAAIERIAAQSPLRRMTTPGGFPMSVAMTSCGQVGWVSDRRGYRYTAIDPLTQTPWPPLPPSLADLARGLAGRAGYPDFAADVCLINRYDGGARMALHQDRDEADLDAPIVSVSLGLPAVFLFGGRRRADRPRRIPLSHGDAVVWGGAARLNFHGVCPVADGYHPATGACRFNLTFRRATRPATLNDPR